MQQTQSGLPWLSAGKAITISLIAYMTIQRALFGNGFTGFGTPFHIGDSILNSFVFTAVFFLAGAHLFHARESRAPIYTALLSILYTFILWTCIRIGTKVVFADYTGSKALLTDIYFEITEPPSTEYWILPALLVNLLVGTLAMGKVRLDSPGLILLSGAACLLQTQLPQFYPFSYLFCYFFYLTLGFSAARHFDFFSNHSKLLLPVALIVFLTVQLLYHIHLGFESYHQSVANILISLPGVFLLFQTALFIGRFNFSMVALVGGAAFSILLMHFVVGSAVREILVNSFTVTNRNVHLFAGVSAAILIPILASAVITHFGIQGILGIPRFVRKNMAPMVYAFFTRKTVHSAILCVFLVVLILTPIGLRFGTAMALDRHISYPHTELDIEESSSAIAEGKRLSKIFGCYMGCHGNNLEGIIFSRVPLIGSFSSANLTHSIEQYSADELNGIIRYGLWPDGSPVVGGMPSAGFRAITDKQLGYILAFIKSIPTQKHMPPPTVLGIKTQLDIIDGQFKTQHELGQEADHHFSGNVDTGISGQQLVRAACTECHGHLFQGNSELGAPPLAVAKAYTLEQFERLLRQGKKLNDEDAGLMGLVARNRFSNFTQDEIEQIFQYLGSRR